MKSDSNPFVEILLAVRCNLFKSMKAHKRLMASLNAAQTANANIVGVGIDIKVPANRELRRHPPRILSPALIVSAMLPLREWLTTQPSSTRRGYKRGRFILPPNVANF